MLISRYFYLSTMFARFVFTSARKIFVKSIWFAHTAQNVPYRQMCSLPENLMTILPHRTDNYGALHFDTTSVDRSINARQFEQLVLHQMDLSSSEKTIRSLWFRISNENVHLIEPLIKLGFEFHHTKPNYVVLVKAMTSLNNIPKYAYTNIGVGALVVDEQMNVLVVKEKHFYVRQMWKFPGGYVEQGEELSSAVEREVLEETGIRGKFLCVLLMRHLHRFAFDCSDMYFVCLLRPLSKEITNCDHEIELCQWAPIEHIKEHMSPFNLFAIDKFLKWKDSSISIGSDTLDPYFASMPRYTVYSMKDTILSQKETIAWE